jgi:hypothetical protein
VRQDFEKGLRSRRELTKKWNFHSIVQLSDRARYRIVSPDFSEFQQLFANRKIGAGRFPSGGRF